MPSLTGQGGMTQEELMRMSSAANEWMAFFMVTIGVSCSCCRDECATDQTFHTQSFLVIGACLSYWRAVRFVDPALSPSVPSLTSSTSTHRWARAVRAGQGPGQDQENNILRSFLAH